MIEVSNLNKTFQIHEKQAGFSASLKALFNRKWIDKHALKNINLNIEQGEIVGLIGANGAGKTTLMKILAGIIHPSSGSVRVLGHDPWQRKNEYRRKIGLIMGQKNQLWWDLPAGDCFLLLKEIYQLSDQEYKKNLDFLIETTGVSKQLNTQIRRLSLGERMKMEIIAAMLHNPSVIFLDEPTIGLDITSQRAIRNFITEYAKVHKPIIILTSHYMEDIESLCRRIVIVSSGEIIRDGNINDIVGDFQESKEIIFQSQEIGDQQIKELQQSIMLIAKLEEITKDGLRVQVKSENVSSLISTVVSKIQVNDIKINEPEISTVIEKIMNSNK